jgi:quercetin dioxygenase-like cupin family protein
MNDPAEHPRIVRPHEGERIQIGGFGTTYKIRSREAAPAAAVIEHTLAPGALAAPMHRHAHEDEITYVLEGEVAIQQAEEIVTAGTGAYVLKPRGIFHTFWNSGASPARLIEIVAPGGFERYFEELQRIIPAEGPPDPAQLLALAARYGVEFDLSSIPLLMERHGVRLG